MQKKLHEEKRYAAEEKASYVMEAEKRKRDAAEVEGGQTAAPALLACGAILMSSLGLLLAKEG